MITGLVVELKGFNFSEEEKKGLLGLFRKATNKIAEMKAQYDKAEVNVDKIAEALDEHWRILTKDIATMDKMYQMNQAYFKELTMYYHRGQAEGGGTARYGAAEDQKKAAESGLPEDAQAANDFRQYDRPF